MIVLVFAIAGLLLGSFFNVLIWRLPRSESIVFPSSHCPNCNRKIRPWENIPVVSYVFLRGKCSGCKTNISLVYPIVEIITALLTVLLWYVVIPHNNITWINGITISLQSLFLILMIPVAVIDFKHQIIPDSISISLLVISFLISFVPGSTTPLQSLLGILSGGGVLWVIGKIGSIILKKGDAMGGGDIKLMAAVGALWGPEIALMSIVFGALLGSLAGIPMLLFKRVEVDHRIPFGPFLGAGIWVSVTAGFFIVSSYISFIDNLFYF